MEQTRLQEPAPVRWLLASPQAGWVWLLPRLWLGWQWLGAGLGKVGDPAWTGAQAGAALSGYIQGALQRAAGPHAEVTGWYARFLQDSVLPNPAFWARLVAYGETAVGVALLLGGLTGIAAFFGSFMNFSFMLAGTSGSNPLMFAVATALVLAWRVAGWIGLDRWLLPWLGTPWEPGMAFRRERLR